MFPSLDMQNDMSTAVMWSKSKPDVEFQYGGRLGKFDGMSSQSHTPRPTLQDAVTRRNQCHDRRTSRDNPDIPGLIDPAARACIALFTATAVDYRNNLHLSAHHRTVRWSDSLGSPRLIDSKIMATGRVVGVVVY